MSGRRDDFVFVLLLSLFLLGGSLLPRHLVAPLLQASFLIRPRRLRFRLSPRLLGTAVVLKFCQGLPVAR